MIDEAVPNAPVDTPVTLVIDGISAELNGVVARKSETATLVRFELSDEASRALGELVSNRQAA
jgi:hypothetical protein